MGPKIDRYNASRRILPGFLKNGFAIAALAAALILLPATTAPTFASDPVPAPSAADQNCLGCHGAAGMEKKLADGDTLQLHVPADAFVKSVHGANGCTSCHSDVDPAAHPPTDKKIDSKRSFAVATTQVCRTCHADKFEQWESSIHGALVRSGNPAAPVCTDCHNPHAVIKDAATKIDQVPCKNCHADIYTAYLGSMHAKSRIGSKDSYAPICSGCHSAHAVKPTSLGQGPEAACFGCHAGALESHQKWLPNAALHFEVVSCPACHTPGAQRKVDLMLIDGKGHARGTEQIGVPLFDASTNSDGKGIDAQALWNLMQTLNRSGIAGKTVLRGRLNVLTGPQAHSGRQEQGAQRLPHLSSRRIAGLPERDHLAGRAGRPARRLRRQRGCAEFGILGRLGARLLCDRRHQNKAPGYSVDPRHLGRRRHRRRPRFPRLDVQALRPLSSAKRTWPSASQWRR